jgi:hypothetical protein
VNERINICTSSLTQPQKNYHGFLQSDWRFLQNAMRTACSSASSLRDGSAIPLFTPPPPLPLPPSLLFTLNTTPKFLEEKFGDICIAKRSLSLPQISPPKFLEEKFGDICIAKRSLYPKHHPRNS